MLKRLAQGDEQGASEAADSYRSILGDGNFYIEIQEHGIDDQARLHPQLVELARRQNIPLLATNDTHYTHPEQYEAHDLLVCIQTASNLDTPGRMRFENNEFYLKPAAEMRRLFHGELPEAFDNSLVIAEQCNVSLDFEGLRLPHFDVPDGETEGSWLRKECERGLVERYPTLTDEIRNRLDYELGIIDRMGYSAYFLIVADFIRFARERGIMTTCRGSAPGSIVTYSLGITPVDPLEYGLPFERFLNPDRVTMPDIDIDFQDSRRDEVIEYVTRKYGDDRVAQIITFGTLGAKAAIRDVGRAMGLTYAEADRVAKAVPLELNISLDRAVETSPQLRELMAGDDRVDKLIGIAKQLEGVSRHASTHAAGHRHLARAADRDHAAPARDRRQDHDDPVRDARLRGARPPEVRLPGPDQPHDPGRCHRPGGEAPRRAGWTSTRCPLDDKKTFELLGHGDTMGVFQLEGSGMRRYVRELKPTEVRDLAAMVALFRPGPMANIPAYIRRKHGEEPVTYLHESLEPALRDTYGIFVYQEDIMTAAIAMADYTGPEADNLCYAIRKKKEDVLRQHEAKFKAGAKKKGIPPHIVDKVFAEFEPFARYGFNKAHATCYGLIAYQTAYLKANYPIEFMTAVMNGFRERAEKVAAVIAECRRLGIEVRPPDVQKSHALFTVETDASGAPEAIRFGLAAIKNVGEGAVDAIVAVRDGGAEPGPFVSLDDFCRRVDLHVLNRRVARVADQGERHGVAGHRQARCWKPWTRRWRTARGTSATWRRGSRRCSTSSRCRRRAAGPRSSMAATRSRSASGCGGRRSSSASTSRTIRCREIENELPDYVDGATSSTSRRRPIRRRSPWAGHRRQLAPRDHPCRLDDARRDPRGPHRLRRGRRLPEGLRADRRRRGPTTRSCSSPAASTAATRRRRSCARPSGPGRTRRGWASTAFGAERDRALGATRPVGTQREARRARRSRWRRPHPSRWPSPRPSARRSPPRSLRRRPTPCRSSPRRSDRPGWWP